MSPSTAQFPAGPNDADPAVAGGCNCPIPDRTTYAFTRHRRWTETQIHRAQADITDPTLAAHRGRSTRLARGVAPHPLERTTRP